MTGHGLKDNQIIKIVNGNNPNNDYTEINFVYKVTERDNDGFKLKFLENDDDVISPGGVVSPTAGGKLKFIKVWKAHTKIDPTDGKIKLTNHGLTNDQIIRIEIPGDLKVGDAGVKAGELYVVAEAEDNDFKLKKDPAGDTLVLTGDLSKADKALLFTKVQKVQ